MTIKIVDPETPVKNLLTNSSSITTIELKQLPTGEIVVSNGDNNGQAKTKEEILEKQYAQLKDKRIAVREAAKTYGVHPQTNFKWIGKGYITVLESEPVKLVNEAEVKYCVDEYRKKKKDGLGFYGAPLLDKNGLPYELKHRDLAEHRRKKQKS